MSGLRPPRHRRQLTPAHVIAVILTTGLALAGCADGATTSRAGSEDGEPAPLPTFEYPQVESEGSPLDADGSLLEQVGAVELPEPTQAAPPPSDPTPDGDYTFATWQGNELRLSLWRPDGASGAPVILWIHGGGWGKGSRDGETISAHARWFADHGYLVASVDYPLSSPERHTWDVAEGQIGCAMEWIGQHAEDHGGDPTSLAAIGESAGGHLALQVAYRSAAGTFTSACGGATPAIDVVSVLYPVVEPAAFYENPNPDAGAFGRSTAEDFTGGTPEEFPERYEAITPATHVGPNTPPTLITVGAVDQLVSAEVDARLTARLQAEGIDTELVIVPGADHAFDDDTTNPQSRAWQEITLDWLTEHGVG